VLFAFGRAMLRGLPHPPEFWERFLAEIVTHPDRPSPALGVFPQLANRESVVIGGEAQQLHDPRG